jgi:hypothetical protein
MTPNTWPWNKARPISWGNRMTVCISAICQEGKDKSIVMASDQMISMGGYTGGDSVTVKLDPLYFHWWSQFSANDVSAILPVYENIRKRDASDSRGKQLRAVTDVAEMCKDAYKAGRLGRIQDEVLAEHGMTWEDLKEGPKRLNERDFQMLSERIRRFNLELEMLVAGFDERKEPHIFTVSNPGTANFYDKLGFWAIGSGQPNALAALFACEYRSEHHSLEECVAKVLSAKFSAESAQGVGKSTFLIVYNDKDEVLYLPDSLEDQIKNDWKKLPRFPAKKLPKIREALEQMRIKGPEQSNSQKSKDRQ